MASMEIDADAPEFNLPTEAVITKYKTAAAIANKALATVIAESQPGRRVVELCAIGDRVINEEAGKNYKSVTDKGVAFPTCLSVGHCAGHFSPLADDATVLNAGDILKIDLGAHVDGFIAVAAHTIVVGANPQAPITGRVADAICAAHFALETALRLMRPGRKNTDVSQAIQKVTEEFHVAPLEGVLSHDLKRFLIDGPKVIANKVAIEHRVEEFTFEENQAYALDIVVSTGEGKAIERDQRTTIYKRVPDAQYLVKMKASKYVLSEITKRFPTLPFTLRALDENRGRLGIAELLTHGLVNSYPVLWEKQGETVVQFKTTVLVMATANHRLTELPLPFVQSQYSITDPAIRALLETSVAPKKKQRQAAGGAQPPQQQQQQQEQPPAAAPMDTA